MLQEGATETTYRDAILALLTAHPGGLTILDLREQCLARYQAVNVVTVAWKATKRLSTVIKRNNHMFQITDGVTGVVAAQIRKRHVIRAAPRVALSEESVIFSTTVHQHDDSDDIRSIYDVVRCCK
jgi:hypothetical protein